MTLKTLKDRIEPLGEIRRKADDLKASERQLSAEIRAALGARKNPLVETAHFVANLAERRSLTINPRKLRKKASDRVFLECVRVDLKVARRHFPQDQLDRLGTVARSRVLRISRKPAGKGKDPG